MPEAEPTTAVHMTRGSELPWSDHRSGMRIQFGVSEELCGSQGVFMTRQVIPPGMASTPHMHTNCETAMFILRGPVVMRHGDRLQHEHRAETGDFMYIPANAVHQAVNPSASDDAEVVLCRNAAEEIVREVDIERA
jgi:uncharacterized RmlC-like cupin family protein